MIFRGYFMTIQLASPTTIPAEPRPKIIPEQPSPIVPAVPQTPMQPFTKPTNPDEHQCPHIDPATGLPTCGVVDISELSLFS
jgi:hypothetical protein